MLKLMRTFQTTHIYIYIYIYNKHENLLFTIVAVISLYYYGLTLIIPVTLHSKMNGLSIDIRQTYRY